MKRKGPSETGNILMTEIIGTRLRVMEHSDPGLEGLEGIVLDETLGTFLIDNGERRKMIPKKGGKFELEETSGSLRRVIVNGVDILYRPEDRTKKLDRKKVSRRR